jgi:hypothetical protein
MADLNKLNCGTSKANTGYGDCVLNFGKIVGAIEVPEDLVLTQTELTDLQKTLKDLIQSASKSSRIYPFPSFAAITDSSQDPTLQTLGYGSQQVVREGNYNWVFQFINGALCVSNKLRTHNNSYGKFLFFDDKNVLFGTQGATPAGVKGLTGISLDMFYVYPWKANDGSNVTQYRILFDFQPSQVNEYLAYVQADFNLLTLMGLENAVLKVLSGPTAGVVQIGVTTGCSQENLFDELGADLAMPDLWAAYDDATGAEIPISSTAVNNGLKGYTITLDTTDAAYTAVTATGKIRLEFADTEHLAAVDIYGYEGIPVVYVRGA